MPLLNNKKENSGYIALISAIVMTIILTLVSVTASHSSFFGRFDSLTLELKDRSYALAKGCLEHAKLKLAQEGSYLGDEIIVVGADSCAIEPILVESGNTVITSKATVENINTKLRLTVDSPTLRIVSLEEMGGL